MGRAEKVCLSRSSIKIVCMNFGSTSASASDDSQRIRNGIVLSPREVQFMTGVKNIVTPPYRGKSVSTAAVEREESFLQLTKQISFAFPLSWEGTEKSEGVAAYDLRFKHSGSKKNAQEWNRRRGAYLINENRNLTNRPREGDFESMQGASRLVCKTFPVSEQFCTVPGCPFADGATAKVIQAFQSSKRLADFPHVTKPARTYYYYLGNWDAANADRLNGDRAAMKKDDLALVSKTR